jgi:prepilin-type N-terminal cleavage/methylation domain-containing protein
VVRRAAFTLIELIFAIVIISIVFLSLPSMTQATQASSEGSLAQEGIFISSAKIAQILTYHWDENSVDNSIPLSTAKIVEVTGNSAYNRVPTTTRRVGSIAQSKHRKFHDSNLTIKTMKGISVDNAANNTLDIDDTIDTDLPLENAGISSLGYKQDYKMDIAVGYISDAGTPADAMTFNLSDTVGTTPSNIKIAEVSIKRQLSDNSWELLTRLRAYSANIGEIDYYSRVYQ